jgi:hypothetical protein
MGLPPAHVDDVSVGDWISSRLGTFGSVGGLVPLGFDRYAQLAAADAEPTGVDNGLSSEALAALSEVLSSDGSVTGCYFGIWEGHGWVAGGGLVTVATASGEPLSKEALDRIRAEADAPAFPSAVLKGPKLRLPHRDYLLFSGPLGAVPQLGRQHSRRFEACSPDLIWPDSRDWFLATDTDLRFAYVGGRESLLNSIAHDSRLVAVTVSTEDWLGEIEPDRLNAP